MDGLTIHNLASLSSIYPYGLLFFLVFRCYVPVLQITLSKMKHVGFSTSAFHDNPLSQLIQLKFDESQGKERVDTDLSQSHSDLLHMDEICTRLDR